MSAPSTIDAGRLGIMLNELRLPSMKAMWADFAARADKEGWPAARFLGTLAEHEPAERDRRRIERHLLEARLPPGKALGVADRQVLRAPVAMVYEPTTLVRTTLVQGLLQGIQHEGGVSRPRDPPRARRLGC